MSGETEYELVRIIKEVPEFMGVDLEEYGPFNEGDIVEIPEDNADILVNRGNAEFSDDYEEISKSEAEDSSPEWEDISDQEYNDYAFFRMQFEDEGADLYVEDVEVEDLEKTVYVVYLEDSGSGERKEVGIDFNPLESEQILEDYVNAHSPEVIKTNIQKLRGENPQ